MSSMVYRHIIPSIRHRGAHAAFLAELIADPLLRRHLLSVVAAVDGGGEQQHLTAMLQVLSLISGVLSLTSRRALRSRVVQAPEYF